jgi:hypothetical protein
MNYAEHDFLLRALGYRNRYSRYIGYLLFGAGIALGAFERWLR